MCDNNGLHSPMAEAMFGLLSRPRKRLVSHGTRAIAPITGSTFEGPRLRGKVLGAELIGHYCAPTEFWNWTCDHPGG